jgi:spermidine synthase
MKNLRLLRRGKTARLVAPEGTFSIYHPKRPFTDTGWDAQTASLLMIKHTIQSVLVLGLGGGTVARQCRLLLPSAEIVGVEIDECVLKTAYDYFELNSIKIKTFTMPGQTYLRKNHRRFDAIIDDMWLPEPQSPKPIFVEPDWANLIHRRLRDGGMYTVNLYNRKENPAEVTTAIKKLGSLFPNLRETRPGLGPTTSISAGFTLRTPREARTILRSLSDPIVSGLTHVSFRTISAFS